MRPWQYLVIGVCGGLLLLGTLFPTLGGTRSRLHFDNSTLSAQADAYWQQENAHNEYAAGVILLGALDLCRQFAAVGTTLSTNDRHWCATIQGIVRKQLSPTSFLGEVHPGILTTLG